jgi:spore germination cell wall hydrolase CwlJ-like protein
MNGFKVLYVLLALLISCPVSAMVSDVETEEVEISTLEFETVEVLALEDVELSGPQLDFTLEEIAVIVTEELPQDPQVAKLNLLLERAKQENANRSRMRSASLTDTECLATAMYHEARGESSHGIKAVAFVIYNRVKSNLFPSSFCEVVLQKSQFSFVSDKNPDNIREWNIYEKVLALAIDLVENGGFQQASSPVGNALFFNSFKRASTWKHSSGRKFVATIGGHHFFR